MARGGGLIYLHRVERSCLSSSPRRIAMGIAPHQRHCAYPWLPGMHTVGRLGTGSGQQAGGGTKARRPICDIMGTVSTDAADGTRPHLPRTFTQQAAFERTCWAGGREEIRPQLVAKLGGRCDGGPAVASWRSGLALWPLCRCHASSYLASSSGDPTDESPGFSVVFQFAQISPQKRKQDRLADARKATFGPRP